MAGTSGGMSSGHSGPAAPASGTKYGGFGSDDIAKFGYNKSDQFGTGPYDPYTKTQSTTTQPAPAKDKKEERKKPARDDSDDDSDDSSDSDVDSDDSEA